MTDKQFLQWVHDRMAYYYGENPLADYMHKLRELIEKQDNGGVNT